MSLLYLACLIIHQPGILEGGPTTGCQHDGEHAQPLNSPASTLTSGIRIGHLNGCLVLPSVTRAEHTSCRTTSLSGRVSLCVYFSLPVAWSPTTVNPYDPICSLRVQSPGLLYHPWCCSGLKPCSHRNMCMGGLRYCSEPNQHASWRAVPADPYDPRCKFDIHVMHQRLTSIGINCRSVELDSDRAGGNETGQSAHWDLV